MFFRDEKNKTKNKFNFRNEFYRNRFFSNPRSWTRKKKCIQKLCSYFVLNRLLGCIETATVFKKTNLAIYYRSRRLSVDFCSCFWCLMRPVPYQLRWIPFFRVLLFYYFVCVVSSVFKVSLCELHHRSTFNCNLALLVVWPVVTVVDNGKKRALTHVGCTRLHTHTDTSDEHT